MLDFELSSNNVIVEKDTAMEAGKTILNKAIKGAYKQVSQVNADDDDFKGHEEYLTKDKHGNDIVQFNTVPMGTFTSEGYISTINVDGEDKEVLVADAVLWYSQFKDACELLLKWFNEGVKINMSCEYLYYNYEFIDGVEVHKSPIIFEAHTVLGKNVVPAYESATVVSMNQLNQFNRLVAQAVNKEKDKEDVILKEEEKLKVNEKKEVGKTQLNELSHDDIRSQIRTQVKSTITDEEWTWVNDVYETYAVVEIETEDSWKHYRFDYSIENDVVTVNLESKVEVKQKREWVEVTNELQVELDKVKSEKSELLNKFNSASETIIDLKSTIDQLEPFKEQMLNAQRETKLNELNEKFAKAFNNAGAKEKFDSEEVQSLLNEAVESVESLSKLNEMVVDLISQSQVKSDNNIALLGLNSERKNLIKEEKDDFELRFKL